MKLSLAQMPLVMAQNNMQFYLLILYVIFFMIMYSCNQKTSLDNKQIVMGYGKKVDDKYPCDYVFDENNILIKNYCYPDSPSITNIIYFYKNGIIKSVEPYVGKNIHGTKIDYFESGFIKQISDYNDGKVNGIIKIFYPSGYLKGINLIENDSFYYVRIYPDSLKSSQFTEDLIPIVTIENDTFNIGDSIEIQVKFPLNPNFGLDTGKFILRYDQKPSELLEGKNPFASYSVPIRETDIWIGVTSTIPAHDKFYCYITDKEGKISGPIIYRDLYFVR